MRFNYITSVLSVIILWFLVASQIALAQAPVPAATTRTPPPGTDPADTAMPSTGGAHGLAIDLGLQLNIDGRRTKKTGEYTKITYKGQMINESGKPLKNGDTQNQFLKKDESLSNTEGLLLDFAQGTGSVNDPRLNALGVNKITIPRLNLYPFSSVTGISASLDDASRPRMRGLLGVESPSIHLIPRIASWLRLGTNFEQELQPSGDGGNQSTGTLSYRAFIGDARWTRSVRAAPFKLDDVLTLAPNKAMLLEIRDKPNTANAELSTFIKALAGRFDTFPGVKLPSPPDLANPNFVYANWVRDQYSRYQRAYSLEPSAALWLETAGWFTCLGNEQGPRFQSLVALVATLYQNAGTSTARHVQLRYETGYDRAAPGVRRNVLLLTAGLSFE